MYKYIYVYIHMYIYIIYICIYIYVYIYIICNPLCADTVTDRSVCGYLGRELLDTLKLALLDLVLGLHELQLLLEVSQHLHRARDLLAQFQQLLKQATLCTVLVCVRAWVHDEYLTMVFFVCVCVCVCVWCVCGVCVLAYVWCTYVRVHMCVLICVFGGTSRPKTL